LMLKLAHGVVSWLVAHEVPVRHVAFAFPRPDFAEDYRILFPAEVEYDAPCSTIHFDSELAEQRFERPYSDLRPFLERAPRDWIFTTYKEHTLSMKVRDFAIFELINTDKSLEDIAYDHGFASVSIFHRAFKRWTGNTPGEYRRTRLIVPHVIP